MKSRWTVRVALGLAVMLRVCAAAPADTSAKDKPISIRISALEGDVEAKIGGADWAPAKVDMELGKGDEIQTGLFSWVELAMANDTKARLDSVTRVRVDKYLKDAQAIRTRLKLKSGAVSAVVNKGQLESDFRVSSPQSTASVRGSHLARFRTTPRGMFGDMIRIGDKGTFLIIARDLARATYASNGQRCEVTTTQVLGTLLSAGMDAATQSLPLGSTPMEMGRSLSSRRLGDVPPGDAHQGAGGVPGIPRGTSPPPSGGGSNIPRPNPPDPPLTSN